MSTFMAVLFVSIASVCVGRCIFGIATAVRGSSAAAPAPADVEVGAPELSAATSGNDGRR